MKFSADRKILLAATRTAQKAIALSSLLPAEAKGVLLNADIEHGLIRLTGTSIRTSIQTISDGHIEDGGAVIVPAALLADIFAHFSDDMVHCKLNGKTLHLACGTATFDIPTMPAKKFPKASMPVPNSIIRLNGIRPITRRSVIATSTCQQTFQAVKLSFSADESIAYAYDGLRLINASSCTCANGTLDVVIHRDALKIFNSIINDDDALYLGVVERFAVFFKEDLIFSTLMSEGFFRDVRDITAQMPVTAHALVDSAELYRAVDMAVGCLQAGDDPCVNLCVLNHEVVISATAFTVSSNLCAQAADTEPTPSEGYNYVPRLLLDYLRIASGPLKLDFYGDKGFLVLTANRCKYAVAARGAAQLRNPKNQKAKSKDTKSKITDKKTPKKAA